VTLAVVALMVLAGVFHPASIRALDAADRTNRSGGQTDQAGQTPG
jgi:hypothetical protein